MITKSKIELLIEEFIDGDVLTVDELLEELDISPLEAFEALFESGLIDEDTLDSLLRDE